MVRNLSFAVIAFLLILPACGPTSPTPINPSPISTTSPTSTEIISPTSSLPPVTGPDPSSRVAVFYYPWFRNPSIDGEWFGWDFPGRNYPPLDIASDYYPLLGAYSTSDEHIVSQHFAWLREAGVGVIIVSWWGQGSREDQTVPVLLEVGKRYGIQVAFQVENYQNNTGTRTADQLVKDVQYIYDRYGDESAFYHTTAPSRWSPNDKDKGLFFLYAPNLPGQASLGTQTVDASYWQSAIETIHAMPQGGLVIACTTDSSWVDGGHFDGLYNYITLHADQLPGFSWAQGLPMGAWYVPSVMPGNSARRIGYPEDTYVSRQGGATYIEQWEAALENGVEPELVTITSFNEWGEGTQIEPAATGVTNGVSYTYSDYSPLPSKGYLHLTRPLIDYFLAKVWGPTHRLRIHMTTTSGWTTLGLVCGGALIRPTFITVSEEATYIGTVNGRLLLTQPLERVQAGGSVETTVDILLTNVRNTGALVFEIERGNRGWTRVELFNYEGAEPILVKTFVWGGIGPDDRNTFDILIRLEELLQSTP